MVLKSTTYQDFPKRNHNIKHSVLWTTWSVAKSTGIYFCSFTANHGNCSSSFFPRLTVSIFLDKWAHQNKFESCVSCCVCSSKQRHSSNQILLDFRQKTWFSQNKLLHLLRLTMKRHQLICTANAQRHVKWTHRGMSMFPQTAVSSSCCWNTNIHDGPACACLLYTSDAADER